MSNPNTINYKGEKHPDTYQGTYWPATPQFSDRYKMAGPQNYWFYLIAEGGTGTNDNGLSYYVAGMGKDKAAKIVYWSLVAYITNSSQYIDARYATIQAAVDIYMVCAVMK